MREKTVSFGRCLGEFYVKEENILMGARQVITAVIKYVRKSITNPGEGGARKAGAYRAAGYAAVGPVHKYTGAMEWESAFFDGQ